MIELKGKYAEAKVFTDLVDAASMAQVQNLLNQPFVEGSQIRMMPDIHAGAGCTIGTTMTITDKICPNLVGVDIGCGMLVVPLEETEIDLEKLDRVIRENVPAGFNKREESYALPGFLTGFRCVDELDLENAGRSVGTLGGGNHFIEVDKDDDGKLYLVIHSGSRHLGVEVATYYQHRAIEQCRGGDAQNIITALKAAGREKEIESALRMAKTSVPNDLAYLTGELLDDYINDMRITQRYAKYNRIGIAEEILHHYGLHSDPYRWFETVHNYIDTKDMILRKGAVSAKAGERLIIPMNMKDGSLICVGKGNPDWNYSAPHGAGRVWSRSEAKRAFTVEEFQRAMNGVYTTSVGQATLDECPMAYKPMQQILDNIGDTVTVEKIIRPIYNFKAGN